MSHEGGRSATGLQEIGAVARQLGVAPSTLRTWERRYGRIVPQRGRQGQRLYDASQVVLLRRVLTQVRSGTRASRAHDLAVGPQPLRTVRVRVRPDAHASQNARRAIDRLLRGGENPRFAFFLRLVASELIKNAVVHGSGRSTIAMTARLFADAADIEIVNAGGRLRLRDMRERRQHGARGLDIVDELADAWSIDTGPIGTKVTVRLSAGTANGLDVWDRRPDG
jgi:DNA-binding transcriptional MerR regulator